MDALLLPTTGTIIRRAGAGGPFRLNHNLGYYTNFANLLDLCAIAAPDGFQTNALPCGIASVASGGQR